MQTLGISESFRLAVQGQNRQTSTLLNSMQLFMFRIFVATNIRCSFRVFSPSTTLVTAYYVCG